MRKLFISVCLILTTSVLSGEERARVSGKVVDPDGRPIAHATVMVHAAGVKKGYSIYCPTCYADCGKRTLTGSDGSFAIGGLSPDLWFKLLVVHDGYAPEFVDKADPAKGPLSPATLKPRKSVDDPARVVRGKLVNIHGRPLRDAVIQPQGVTIGPGSARYGSVEGLEPVAVTNGNGEFEVAYAEPARAMLLLVQARGMAPKLFKEAPTGMQRQTMTVIDGATIRGRLMDGGKPVGGAEIGLFTRNSGMSPNPAHMGDPYTEIRIGTKSDGTFVITNVPSPVGWYLYAKMDSIAARGAAAIVECATKRDGESINVGDIQVKLGRRVSGKVVLSDAKAIAGGMRITICSDRAFDCQTAMLPSDGRFEFAGLRNGDQHLLLASVRGYRQPENPQGRVNLSMDRDVDDLVMVLEPVIP